MTSLTMKSFFEVYEKSENLGIDSIEKVDFIQDGYLDLLSFSEATKKVLDISPNGDKGHLQLAGRVYNVAPSFFNNIIFRRIHNCFTQSFAFANDREKATTNLIPKHQLNNEKFYYAMFAAWLTMGYFSKGMLGNIEKTDDWLSGIDLKDHLTSDEFSDLESDDVCAAFKFGIILPSHKSNKYTLLALLYSEIKRNKLIPYDNSVEVDAFLNLIKGVDN